MPERVSSSPAALERALVELGPHVATPVAADLAPVVLARLREPVRPTRRRARIAIAVVTAAVAALLALPAPRHAVADWLGLGAVRIVHTNLPGPPAGSKLLLGRQVQLDEARRAAGGPLVTPTALGAPTAVYVGEPAATSVTLVWAPRDGLPEVRDTGVGALLTEIRGSLSGELIEKMIHTGTSVEPVTVGSTTGYWISGNSHDVYYVDPSGEPRPDTAHLAATTLLWAADGVTYRLESKLDAATAIDLATHVTPL
jgi:hypothetical protein